MLDLYSSNWIDLHQIPIFRYWKFKMSCHRYMSINLVASLFRCFFPSTPIKDDKCYIIHIVKHPKYRNDVRVYLKRLSNKMTYYLTLIKFLVSIWQIFLSECYVTTRRKVDVIFAHTYFFYIFRKKNNIKIITEIFKSFCMHHLFEDAY